MRIDIHGLTIETPCVTVSIWTPWRASALEFRLFDAVRQATQAELQEESDELSLDLEDPKSWRAAVQAMLRVLKGWQEEGDPARERRSFRWLLEGECDAHGYDSMGEPLALWVYVQLGLEHGGYEDGEKSEIVDLEGFGLRIERVEAGN